MFIKETIFIWFLIRSEETIVSFEWRVLKMRIKKLIALAAIGFVITVSSGVSTTNAYAAVGEKIFKKCKACHKFGKNGVGPDLAGIVDRKAGAMKFKYSKALKAKADEGLVWTEANLDAFLKKPKKFIKKTRMSFNGLKKESHRKTLIEYLKTK